MNPTRLALCILFVALHPSSALAQTILNGEGDFRFEIKHRVNAHGDEFNSLARSADGRRLFTGTEKGDIIVWDLATNRVERTLHQPSGVHVVVALSDPREFVAASSDHLKPKRALVRKWNVETGTFVDLTGIDTDADITGLATDTGARLIAAATGSGTVVVWDSQTNQQLAQWKVSGFASAVTLLGRNVYVGTLESEPASNTGGVGVILKLNLDDPNQRPKELFRVPGRYWSVLGSSPDGRLLSATYREGYSDGKTAVIDPVSKSEIGNFAGAASLWLNASQLMLFDWMNPVQVFQVSAKARAKSIRKFARMEADTQGRAFDLTGQVSNADGSKAWASYRKGPGLLEFDLATNKIKTLIGGPSGAYGVSVVTPDGQTGELLTGGADGYVRLWSLADVSLIKEYKVAKAGEYVGDALLVPNSRRAVVEVGRIPDPQGDRGPSEIVLLDLESGQQQKLFDLWSWRARVNLVDNAIIYPEGNHIRFRNLDGTENRRELSANGFIGRTAISANKRWLAVTDETKTLTVFDLNTDEKKTIAIGSNDAGPIVVTDDGAHVYSIGGEGALTHWDTSSGTETSSVLQKVRELHSRVDFIMLANDDRWLVTAGNHHDVGIFDRATGRPVFYMQVQAAAFYVEKVWLKDKRLIVTTDIGVLYDGLLR
jgi:WD40 repeat protein